MAATVTPEATRRGAAETTGRPLRRSVDRAAYDRPTARSVRTHTTHADTRIDSPRRTGTSRNAEALRRPTRTRSSRLGSRQQVSVRGRRVTAVKDNSRLVKLVALPVLAFVLGIGVVMWISGLATAQSFQLSAAQKHSTTLANEIESLERDAEVAKSGATIAKEAAKLGMVAPDQAGVIDAQGAEAATVREPGVGKDKEITDVNSDARPRGATSNPDKTANVEGLAPQEAVVAGVGAHIASNTGGLPYDNRTAPRGPEAANPAPPAPAPAPAAPAPAAGHPAPPAPAAPPA
ncbi:MULTISPECIES: hypothetical protein [Corynebacterium]|uniref:hypothetical protein n=1 Tax=Corynebacterium TaxID=1716 RepID=UPI001658E94B|nr:MULTISPECIES: hypothetical protein [Corynebacterium]QNP92838.1 hypothetical protein IAU67_03360 [Corynebacterium zhongnanshanii]